MQTDAETNRENFGPARSVVRTAVIDDRRRSSRDGQPSSSQSPRRSSDDRGRTGAGRPVGRLCRVIQLLEGIKTPLTAHATREYEAVRRRLGWLARASPGRRELYTPRKSRAIVLAGLVISPGRTC